jgi:hypothetical protein
LFAVVCLMSFVNTALACACCAEEGTYILWTGKPGESENAILDSMKFDRKTKLYLTEAGFDMVKGLDSLRPDYESEAFAAWDGSFDLVNEFTNKTWKFTIKSPSGKTGTLTLPMPTQMVQFKVDTHDTKDLGLGPRLYKEFRFKGFVQNGTGMFRASLIKPTTYFLVFQGHGNFCDDVSDFTNWHLEIDSKKAQYEFNGQLISAQ